MFLWSLKRGQHICAGVWMLSFDCSFLWIIMSPQDWCICLTWVRCFSSIYRVIWSVFSFKYLNCLFIGRWICEFEKSENRINQSSRAEQCIATTYHNVDMVHPFQHRQLSHHHEMRSQSIAVVSPAHCSEWRLRPIEDSHSCLCRLYSNLCFHSLSQRWYWRQSNWAAGPKLDMNQLLLE